MPLPSLPSFKTAFRRRPAKNNSLDLIRSLTIQRTAWVNATRRLPVLQSRFYAELREQVLLLYPADQILQYSSQASTLEHLQRQSETLLSAIAQSIPAKFVTSFSLDATRFLPRPQKAVVLKTPGRLPTRVLFDSEHEKERWLDDITNAINRDKKRLSEFNVLKHVGKGASGRVYKVLDTTTNEILALKVIEKAYVFESESSYRHAMDERIVLQIVRHHPFVLDMRYALQNSKRLFLVTEYCGGGDMFEYLNQQPSPLDEEATRFVAAEVILAIEHLHNLGIVYRDLKLENILIDADGHIRLADFGLTKVLRQDNGKLKRTNTFCGTKEYVAPEMIRGDPYDMSLDFWALGILLYELMSGKTPFYHDDHDQIYDRIEKAPIFFPMDLSSEARSLIASLLKRRPIERLGTGSMGLEEIKLHEWFRDVDWDAVRAKTLESPLRKGLRFRRESTEDSAHMSARARKRHQQKQKAMAAVKADVREDSEYVSLLSSSVSISSRPKSPMEKRGGGILAGYCFRNIKPYTPKSTEAPQQLVSSAILEEFLERDSPEINVTVVENGAVLRTAETADIVSAKQTNTDPEPNGDASEPDSVGSTSKLDLAIEEDESISAPTVTMTTPTSSPKFEKRDSLSVPNTPASVTLSPTAENNEVCSRSAPDSPSEDTAQLSLSHHFRHLYALLQTSSGDNKDESATEPQSGTVPGSTVEDARIETVNIKSCVAQTEEDANEVRKRNELEISNTQNKQHVVKQREFLSADHVEERNCESNEEGQVESAVDEGKPDANELQKRKDGSFVQLPTPSNQLGSIVRTQTETTEERYEYSPRKQDNDTNGPNLAKGGSAVSSNIPKQSDGRTEISAAQADDLGHESSEGQISVAIPVLSDNSTCENETTRVTAVTEMCAGNLPSKNFTEILGSNEEIILTRKEEESSPSLPCSTEEKDKSARDQSSSQRVQPRDKHHEFVDRHGASREAVCQKNPEARKTRPSSSNSETTECSSENDSSGKELMAHMGSAKGDPRVSDVTSLVNDAKDSSGYASSPTSIIELNTANDKQ
ncbi:Ribosomal protein S6 kinase beta [Gracilariopsis chorda]|uniref:Ribosomal protein S6 kinase beta n=1 Tax=Gracilariopsis chorda TaxID=448386 RepID=A0A2V3IU24_9FLOR|nr:Ribosomal protein S6 kinase beta [Gracilariopsis chorda]|eukprot:PXF45638.1 Ribosomal protein S6 kinase beta [Gracilariopsis chorda]